MMIINPFIVSPWSQPVNMSAGYLFTSDATDSIHDNDGSFIGNAQVSNKVLLLDGSGDWVDLVGSSTLVPDNANLSVCGWINGDTWTNTGSTFVANRMFTLLEAAATTNIALGVSTAGKIAVFTRDGTTATEILGSTTLSTGAWYHIGLIVRADSYELYYNGSLDNTPASYNPSAAPSAATASIGGGTGLNRELDGEISRLRIYNTAISAQHMTDIYNTESSNYP